MSRVAERSIRRILANLESKLGRQREAVESTEAQIIVFGEQLSLFNAPKDNKGK